VRPERSTWAEIDLSAIKHNIGVVRQLVGTGVEIMAVVKADAYGHGSAAVARTAVESGVDRLGVATLTEAIELREAGVRFPIQILGCSLPEQADDIVRYNIVQTVSNEEIVRALSRAAARATKTARVHIKVDTGMGRVGVAEHELPQFVRRVSEYESVRIEGLMTHFPCADEASDDFTPSQIERFRLLAGDESVKRYNVLLHAANSAAIVRYPESYFNLVRPGLMLYGAVTLSDCPVRPLLKPALSLKSRIVQIRSMSSGEAVSYGRTYVTPKDTVVAAIPIGYADGFSRMLSNKAQVLVNGKRVPVVGRVCMDQCLVDIADAGEVRLGDIVTLIGADGGELIRAEEVAAWAGTIPHEVLCTIGKRVQRIYVS